MNGQTFSVGRSSLRIKIILVIAVSLSVILSIVGLFVYSQVAEQFKVSLKDSGIDLLRNLSTSDETIKNVLYEQKKDLEGQMQKLIDTDSQQKVLYVFFAQKAKKKKGDKDAAAKPVVFTQFFRTPGTPMDIDSLLEIHMANAGQMLQQNDNQVFEQNEFIGITGPILVEASQVEEPAVQEDKPLDETGVEDPLSEDVFDEGGGANAPEPKGKASAKPGAATPGAKAGKVEKMKAVWGYVCIGFSMDTLNTQKNKLLVSLSVMLALALSFFTVFIYLTSNKLYRRLVVMMDTARRTSDGDLTKAIPDVSADEIGLLASALNRISGNLNDMMRKIAVVTESLGEAVERITAATEEVVRGAEYQVSSVDETSSSVSEMMISLKGIGENVEVLASSAEESSSSILEMAATNDEVADNIHSLATSVEQTTTSIEQMTTAIKEVAKSVEDLSTAAEQTSSSMREMDISISQVEANANETAVLSEEVRRDAERGADAVKKTMLGISRISESTNSSFSVIEALGKKAQAIGQVLTVIDDVAEQTNLLALNAAIIAAQAGEHGKGFAVVADEIKDLAERTAASTSEISGLIRSVQSETKNVIESMQRGLKSVGEGVSLSMEAEEALRKILESSTKSTTMVRAIARATVEQARGSKEVTDAISRIAETVQQIASSAAQQAKGSEQIMNSAERMKIITQHVHASSQEQARGSKQITKAIENISEMVHHLNRAQKEQGRGAEQVMKAVERIKEVAEHHSDSMAKMKAIVDRVAEQAETLRSEMGRFKL